MDDFSDFRYLVSQLSSFLSRKCQWTSKLEGGYELTNVSTLLLLIPILLLRIQNERCFNNMLCSGQILRYLLRFICTVSFGIDSSFYFWIQECLFKFSNLEVFPFIPEGLGSSGRCRSLWRFLDSKASWKEQCRTWVGYIGKYGGGAANGIFYAFEKSN